MDRKKRKERRRTILDKDVDNLLGIVGEYPDLYIHEIGPELRKKGKKM